MTLLKSLLLAVAAGASLGAQGAATLVQDARVFDGERMHARRSVLFDGARIVDADFRGQAPAGAILVDGRGKTLLPGLIDAHTHAYRHQELPLLFGVTTQIDMFVPVPLMQEVTRRMRAGENSGAADLFSAGTLVTAPGGHGTEYGVPIPTLSRQEDAQAFVDARIAEGSHFIKIVMEEGINGTQINSLDSATMRAAVKAAHARGKLAVVHISNLPNARSALEAGADGLVHLFHGRPLDAAEVADFVALVKARKAFVIPTFSVLESLAGLSAEDVLGDPGLRALLTLEQAGTLRTPFGKSVALAKLQAPRAAASALHKAGVVLLAGTDAGNAGTQYGISVHHELAALVQAGMRPEQALAAATAQPARIFGLGQRGRIANGYKADLLLVEGDPGTDITHTRRIVAVWKDGVDAAPLRARQLALVADEKTARPAALPLDGRISLFSKEKLAAPVGYGWMASHDGVMGGKSSAQVVYLDAEGGAAAVDAEVAPGFAYPFAGLAFFPGKQPMQPADLGSARQLRFKVRGDGQQYTVALMSKQSPAPASVPFTAGEAWQEVAITLDRFKDVDMGRLMMIAFNAGPKAGSYRFQIADVRLTAQ